MDTESPWLPRSGPAILRTLTRSLSRVSWPSPRAQFCLCLQEPKVRGEGVGVGAVWQVGAARGLFQSL